MKLILTHSLMLVSYSILLLLASCSPNKTAPIQKDISKAFFRGDWEDDYKKYVTTFEDASSLTGEKKEIKDHIERKINKVNSYQVLDNYIDSITHLNSTIVRIFNFELEYPILTSNPNFSTHFNNFDSRIDSNGNREFYLTTDTFLRYIPGDLIEDTTDCFWLVKNSDNLIHIVYLTPNTIIKDEIIPFNGAIDSALQTVRRWTQNRQVSIPYEKSYKTIVSYWDRGNSYHVFLPLMWNEEDCENHWKCTSKDSSVNVLHSAVLSFLCLAKQKEILH